jgi:hypothetical protein
MKSPTQKALEYARTRCPGFICACCGGRRFHLIESPTIVPHDGDTIATKIITLWCQECSHLHSFLQEQVDEHTSTDF